jgi:hypothetical protein
MLLQDVELVAQSGRLRRALGLSVLSAVEHAEKKGLRVEIHHDYARMEKEVESGSESRDDTVKPTLNRPGFTCMTVVEDATGRVVGTCAYYPVEVSDFAAFLKNDMQRADECWPWEGGVEPPLAALNIPGGIRGKVCMSGAFWCHPEYRNFSGMFPIIRNGLMPYILGVENPDFLVSFIRAENAKRGTGLPHQYGLINYSPKLEWRGYYQSGDSLSVRLVWADRGSLLNGLDRISSGDY